MNDDLISRSALLKDIQKTIEKSGCVNHEGEMFDCIRYAFAVDAVIPVRCKDCERLMFSDCYGECKIGYMGIVQPDDFCSRGERRADK